MADIKKLDRWADKLLDTGKRNNLINFRDTKSTSAEVLFPECESVFSKCSIGRTFEVYDPKIPDDEQFEEDAAEQAEAEQPEAEQPAKDEDKKLSRSEYKEMYELFISLGF